MLCYTLPLAALLVDALLELAHEGVDPDDGEDEPEDEAHEQHVEDAGQGADEGVHHHLKIKIELNDVKVFILSSCQNVKIGKISKP